MMAFLDMLRERYGGAETYAVSICGLTQQDVETIKANLVVGVRSDNVTQPTQDPHPSLSSVL